MLSSSVTVFDPVSLAPLGRIALRECPCKVVVNRPAGRLYVAGALHGHLTRVSLESGEVLDELPVERAPVGLCASPDGRWVYVCNRGAGSVSVLDAASGRESHRIPVGNGPGDCAVDPVTGRLLVSNAGSGTLTVVERPWLPPPSAPRSAHPAVGRPLPEFALPDLRTGGLRRSLEWAEKRYILCFFASW
jgi:YVTN family beta-propeller protein